MIAGTVIVLGKAGPLPGYLLKRGTIFLGGGCGNDCLVGGNRRGR